MNEFDAEKQHMSNDEGNAGSSSYDKSTSTEAHVNDDTTSDHHRQEQADSRYGGYSFIDNDDPAGQQYTTPEGGHGFVYSPRSMPEGRGIGRKLILATAIVGMAMLLMGACFLGAWLAAKSGKDPLDGEGNHGSEKETYDASGTSEGLIIVDGTAAEMIPQPETQAVSDQIQSPADTSGLLETEAGASLDEPDDPPREEVEFESSLTIVPIDTQAPEQGEIFFDKTEDLPTANIQKKEPKREDADGDGKADIAYDENGRVITSAGDSTMTAPTVIAKVSSSVVEISTEILVQSNWIGQYVTSGAGSGVIISEEGYIITNHHVIDGAHSISVRLNDGTEFAATLVGTDERTDVAILWIDAGEHDLTVATLGSSYDLVAGEDILAIGNPLGSLGGTVTEGIISATERQISVDGNDMTLLQVSAPINPGNSGGGLFNMAGELVGVVNAKMSSEEIEGLGFAIPVDTAYDIACELIRYGYIRGRVDMGLTLMDVTDLYTALRYFNSQYAGVYVYDSESEDFHYGDLIMSVENVEISTSEELAKLINRYEVGDVLEFVVFRKNKEVTVELELREYVPDYLREKDSAIKPAA